MVLRKGDRMTPDIYGICLTKNESDIIAFSLRHASAYCKKIFVLDNGSTDNTWELVNSLGEKSDQIVPFERKICRFGRGLRGYVFNRVRDQFKPGDWVMILDSDEFLEKNPASCIDYCESKGYDLIFTPNAQFYVTMKDLNADWFKNPPAAIRSFQELPRYYLINSREPRLFKYRESLEWRDTDDEGNPSNIFYPKGLTRRWNRGVVNRHYQYRSLPQMKARIAMRSGLYKTTGCFKHSQEKDYQQYFRNYERLNKSVEGKAIKATPWDYLRLYLMRRSNKFKRFFHNRTMIKK
jgi:glycosyltransferase involved in cell wall biosynthesis